MGIGAPTPNFLSMGGQILNGGNDNYLEQPDVEGATNTQFTNADVTSIMGADEMTRNGG